MKDEDLRAIARYLQTFGSDQEASGAPLAQSEAPGKAIYQGDFAADTCSPKALRERGFFQTYPS
jgi:hypothetical protein